MSFIMPLDVGKPVPAAPEARGLIHDLDPPRFAAACASLMHQVLDSYRPDLLVGIRTGGLVVAEAMARSVTEPVSVLPLTCRRAATGVKARLKVLPRILTAMPRPVVNRLRWLEHRMLTGRRQGARKPQQIDHGEAAIIGRHLLATNVRRILVVDDAVDSGVTLATVLQLLRQACPPDTEFRTAVVTVTMEQPLVEPDFLLYRGVLCRFPWSFDAAG